MEALAQRALAYARDQHVDLPGPLSGVKAWYIVDSTTIKSRDAGLDDFPGAGDYAALKAISSSRWAAERRGVTIAADRGGSSTGAGTWCRSL
jgi:hypothetical protein